MQRYAKLSPLESRQFTCVRGNQRASQRVSFPSAEVTRVEHRIRRLLQLLGVGHEAAAEVARAALCKARGMFLSRLHALLADDLPLRLRVSDFQVHARTSVAPSTDALVQPCEVLWILLVASRGSASM